jgi:hypothetical protein
MLVAFDGEAVKNCHQHHQRIGVVGRDSNFSQKNIGIIKRGEKSESSPTTPI